MSITYSQRINVVWCVCVCVFCVFFHFTCSIEMKKIRWFMVCDYQFLPFSTLSWHRIQNIFVHFVLFNENCNANVVNHKLHNNNNLFHRTDHIHGINKNLHSRNTTRFFGVSIVLQKKYALEIKTENMLLTRIGHFFACFLSTLLESQANIW